MNFDLPALDGVVTPAFVTTENCKLWLSHQTLANPAVVQRGLREQIELLNRHAIVLRERFGILEMLQPQIAFVQEEVSKRYAAKPLPYLAPEAEAFAMTLGLWQAVTVGYLRCLEEAGAGAAPEQTLATLAQRALATLHAAQLDRVRGFAQPDSRHWSRVHQLLAFAEARGIAGTAIGDKARYGEQAVTPLSVYAEAMLLHAASAHEFSARPLNWVVRWARRWSGKLVLRQEPPADLQAVPINVDLGSSLPPSPFPIKGAGQARFLDTANLAASIRTRLAGLAAGRAPAELELGDDCLQPACEQMLQRLYQRWCKGGMQRPTDRQAASGNVELVAGCESIWFRLAGKPFKQPNAADVATLRREREELAAFGHISERHDNAAGGKAEFRVEADWRIINEGPAGLRLARSVKADNIRVGVGQLIAVRRSGAAGFSLASVRWLMMEGDGEATLLHAGVHLIAGTATPISFRNAGINATKDPWRPGFVLADQSPPQLVLPAGVFRADRTIDVEGGPAKQCRLAQQIERGDDFERVAVA